MAVRTYIIKHPWLVPGFWVSMLLIDGGEGCFLLDTGVKEALDVTLAPFLKERNIPWNAIHQIINTHSHSDHVGCNIRLRELTGAEFSIHHTGAEELRSTGFVFERELGDGDEVCDGNITIKIIHTPGHSPDSLCLLEPETGTLFSGDSIQGYGSDNIGLALYCDPDAYRESLLKVRRLCISGEVRRLILGHPERPSNGEIEGNSLLSFLDDSLKAADGYIRLTEQLLKLKPDADKNELRNLLLFHFGGSCSLTWPELSYNTAEALLRRFSHVNI